MTPTIVKASAWISMALEGIEPYLTTVTTTGYAETERPFRPSHAEVSFTVVQDGTSWPSVIVHGRSPRRGSTDNYATGASVFVRYDAEEAEDITAWPAYVQAIYTRAREVVMAL